METDEARGGPDLIRTKWRTILLLVVGVLGTIVAIALISTLREANSARDRALDRQSHSYEVMILAGSLAGNLAEAEAALGRFVISGDKSLGRLYLREWRLAGQQLQRLGRETRDQPTQLQAITALRQAYQARGYELGQIALNSNYGQNREAIAGYYAARNSVALARTSRILTRLTGFERRLLQRRSAEATQTVDRSNRAAAWLAGFGILLVAGAIALGWWMVQAITQGKAASAEAADERARAIELEAAVAAATADLQAEALVREQAETKLRQVQKMEAVGQLTGGIAHDFNNMLAVILGGLELARRHVPAERGNAIRHIDHATEGARRAAALTRQLLAFARSEPLLPEAIEAGELILGMSDLLDRTLGDAVNVVAEDDGHGWKIWADRHQLENALLNLAVNARDAMGGRGTLTLRTGHATLAAGEIGSCAAGDYATVAVADTGSGMTPAVLERVFEPFFTTKPVGSGTGLGLSQIFGFVRQSSGEISIDSTPDIGTVVTLFLPRHRAGSVGAALRPGTALIGPPQPQPANTNGYDILVVEDDPRVLNATMEALEELGHRPVACGDPMQAEAVIATMPAVDLILSDVLMPGRTGPELVAELHRDWPQAAILFVTGFAGDIADEALADQRVLRKPFTLAALADAVESAVVDRAGPPPLLRHANG